MKILTAFEMLSNIVMAITYKGEKTIYFLSCIYTHVCGGARERVF